MGLLQIAFKPLRIAVRLTFRCERPRCVRLQRHGGQSHQTPDPSWSDSNSANRASTPRFTVKVSSVCHHDGVLLQLVQGRLHFSPLVWWLAGHAEQRLKPFYTQKTRESWRTWQSEGEREGGQTATSRGSSGGCYVEFWMRVVKCVHLTRTCAIEPPKRRHIGCRVRGRLVLLSVTEHLTVT